MREQREILFRGKCTVDGKWYEGNYIETKVGENTVPIITPFGKLTCMLCDGCFYQVDLDTVGQYTGLKDKNGKRIFDGDIVRIKEDEDIYKPGIVEWQASEARYLVRIDWYLFAMDEWDYEVIGNIYDNPELLDG